jgi:hypothetical protein
MLLEQLNGIAVLGHYDSLGSSCRLEDLPILRLAEAKESH